MAEHFAARHLQAVGTFGQDVLEDDAAEAFAALCDRAARFGLLVALEFVPHTNVPDAGVATQLVQKANRPNGGLCVDSWHHFRGRNDDALLQEVPAERVVVVQLDDGPAIPVDDDFFVDTRQHRLPPGHGEFDLTGFLQLLRRSDVRAPVSVEVLTQPSGRSAADIASTLAASSRDVLAAAGW